MTLAKKLNELRRTRGLTLREVERSTGISNAYLSQIETGKIVNPTIRIVQALADFYGETVEGIKPAAGDIPQRDHSAKPVNVMKLIFLDIDGVLNGHSYNEVSQSNEIKPECVARLNRILQETEARIVLSSAWRYMLVGRAMSLIGFDYLLRTHGVIANRLVGRTAADEEVSERGWQIHQWRKENDHCGKYVVLDDMDLHISPLHPFVQTDGQIGLTDSDVDKAIRLLSLEIQS